VVDEADVARLAALDHSSTRRLRRWLRQQDYRFSPLSIRSGLAVVPAELRPIFDNATVVANYEAKRLFIWHGDKRQRISLRFVGDRGTVWLGIEGGRTLADSLGSVVTPDSQVEVVTTHHLQRGAVIRVPLLTPSNPPSCSLDSCAL
jgi:hypothetical protein